MLFRCDFKIHVLFKFEDLHIFQLLIILVLMLFNYCCRLVLNHFKSIGVEMDREISRATYKSLSIGMALEKLVLI